MVTTIKHAVAAIYDKISQNLIIYESKSVSVGHDALLTEKKKRLALNLARQLTEPALYRDGRVKSFLIPIREAQNLVSVAICSNMFFVAQHSGFFTKYASGRLGAILLEAKRQLFLQEWKYVPNPSGETSIINDSAYQNIQLSYLNFLFEELFKVKSKSKIEQNIFHETMIIVETILCSRYVEQMHYLAIQFCAEMKSKPAIVAFCSKFVLFCERENEKLRKYLKIKNPLDNQGNKTYEAQKNVLGFLSTTWEESKFREDFDRANYIVGNRIIEKSSEYNKALSEAYDSFDLDPSYSILTEKQRKILFWQASTQLFLFGFYSIFSTEYVLVSGKNTQEKRQENTPIETGPFFPRYIAIQPLFNADERGDNHVYSLLIRDSKNVFSMYNDRKSENLNYFLHGILVLDKRSDCLVVKNPMVSTYGVMAIKKNCKEMQGDINKIWSNLPVESDSKMPKTAITQYEDPSRFLLDSHPYFDIYEKMQAKLNS